MQDFIAPELREIATRLDVLEKSIGIRLDAQEGLTADRFKAVDSRFDAQEKSIAARMDAQEVRTADRFKAVDSQFRAIDARFDSAERVATERHAQIMQQFGQLNEVNELKVRMAPGGGQRAS